MKICAPVINSPPSAHCLSAQASHAESILVRNALHYCLLWISRGQVPIQSPSNADLSSLDSIAEHFNDGRLMELANANYSASRSSRPITERSTDLSDEVQRSNLGLLNTSEAADEKKRVKLGGCR